MLLSTQCNDWKQSVGQILQINWNIPKGRDKTIVIFFRMAGICHYSKCLCAIYIASLLHALALDFAKNGSFSPHLMDCCSSR